MHIEEEAPVDKKKKAVDEDESPMGAYLEAMRGEDGHTRDAKGRVRFNKTQGKRAAGNMEEDETAVTEGIKELEVGGRRPKKVKRETVKIGAEFKAKVSAVVLVLCGLLALTDEGIDSIERGRRCQEEWNGTVRLPAALGGGWEIKGWIEPGSQDGHYREEEEGQAVMRDFDGVGCQSWAQNGSV